MGSCTCVSCSPLLAGMLFMSDEALDVQRLIDRWIKVQGAVIHDVPQVQGWFKVGHLHNTAA